MTLDLFMIDLFMRQYLLEIISVILGSIFLFLFTLSLLTLMIRNTKNIIDIEPICIVIPFIIMLASFLVFVGNSIQLVRYYYVPEKIIMENQSRIDKDYQDINRVPESYRNYKPEKED